jgi:branched-chain amino acid aminotransferase
LNKNFPGVKYYWHNGKIYDIEATIVHPLAHALHYGSSVFEGIRAYETEKGAAIFRLQDHINRFFYSASVLNMTVPYSPTEIIDACKLIMRKNELQSAYIRPNLFFGLGNLGLIPHACPVELTIACWKWGRYLGETSLQTGIHALLVPNKRLHPSQIQASIKIGGLYVQSNIVGRAARLNGYDEAIFLNLENRVSEGPGENIVIVKNNVLRTNDKSESVLEGITRTTVLQLAEDAGYRTEITPITVEDLLSADEVFFTGTAAEITPICKITDSRNREIPQEEWPIYSIGDGNPGKITLQMAQTYSDVVRGKLPEYNAWLTYVESSN